MTAMGASTGVRGGAWGGGIHSVDRQSLIQDAGNSEKYPCKERWPRGPSCCASPLKKACPCPSQGQSRLLCLWLVNFVSHGRPTDRPLATSHHAISIPSTHAALPGSFLQPFFFGFTAVYVPLGSTVAMCYKPPLE